jgi:hypothetical protein
MSFQGQINFGYPITSQNIITDIPDNAVLPLSIGTSLQGNILGVTFETLKSQIVTETSWGSITGDINLQTDLISLFGTKQNTLVSGNNIKTVNGNSLLGSGGISLTKNDINLSNVDNTSDVNKPVSTATQTVLNSKENLSNKSTDVNLGTSNTLYPSQNAVKVYTDSILGNANALVYKGVIDCSTNPNYPAANAGEMYIVNAAGKIGGVSGEVVEVGDMLICNNDATPSGTQASVGVYWNIIQKNINGAVSGPASSVNNNVAFFDGITGKIIKDSGLALSGNNTGDETQATIKTKLGAATTLVDGYLTTSDYNTFNNKQDKNIAFNRQVASYIGAASDNGKMVEMNVATANTFTINSGIYAAGNQILVSQYGAGQTTITAGAGMTSRSNGGKLKTSGQYAVATIIFISSTEFYVAGDLIV